MPKRANTLKTNNLKNSKNNVRQKRKSSTKKKSYFGFLKNEKFHQILGFFLILLSIYMAFAIVSYLLNWVIDDDKLSSISLSQLAEKKDIKNWTGFIGAFLSHLLIKEWFGISSLLIIFFIFIWGFRLLFKVTILPLFKTFRHIALLLIWFSVFFGLLFRDSDWIFLGGVFGYQSNELLMQFIGLPGIVIGLIFIMISYLMISFKFSFGFLQKLKFTKEKNTEEIDSESEITLKNKQKEDKYNTVEFSVSEDDDIKKPESEAKEETPELTIDPSQELEVTPTPPKEEYPVPPITEEKSAEGDDIELTIEDTPTEEHNYSNGDRKFTVDTEYDPKLELANYKLPGLNLLLEYGDDQVSVQKDELEENKNRIVETLNHYSIKIDKIKATIGPAVTLYEIIPAPGVRISKIKNLEDDIALSLAAMGIRIIAPIPGKGTIGIEVPNKKPDIVSMKSLLSSEKFRNTKMELPLALGKTISNESFIIDLTKMPHILMAGATGQGKSVGLNAILASLLYKKHPAEIKFILVDPKKVELSLFSKIERHFLAKLPDSEEAIITDTRLVVRTLNSLCIEMDNRYELLKDAQVRNIKEYNAKFIARKLNPNHGHRYLPYLVLVVDEFADLIMTAGKEIESPLTRLAQLARAIGIHLIIATQRPSVNIITGTIKANFPARIAFRVISKIDSRTILDTGGADQLIGRGDMLLATGSDITRLQCAFLDTPEVEQMTTWIGDQKAYPEALLLPEFAEEEDNAVAEFDATERDELFEEAAKIIVQTQQGSTSLLQRKLKLGYNRAGRIIDQLEAAGVVGPFEGSKAREVKVANEMALEQFLKDLDRKDEDINTFN
ncbi:MAG: cell division protein FtsK [Bacteroidetes bacterium]|nr:cell division protein FtsK [Bacteroidota bacterium]